MRSDCTLDSLFTSPLLRSFIIIFLLAFTACKGYTEQAATTGNSQTKPNAGRSEASNEVVRKNTARVIHVVVALRDNEFQGIVPVPPRIGNGDDPANNLYWGAGYGVKSFFKRASDWKMVSDTRDPKPAVLERVIFKRKDKDVYMVADAYRGREIKQSTIDFLHFAAGGGTESVAVEAGAQPTTIYAGGGADLIAYVGHDGLMDFSLDQYPQKRDDRQRDAVILACVSKSYFNDPLRRTGARPLLWTTGLMAPEAYVLKAAIDGWALNESGEKIRRRAAEAYNKYQRCGMRGALNLFSHGW
ncbi:MAG: hypothetical protein L0229_00605 [Blastocatellia bacterium]|nr:hypothetical protein [Blastocatellia bacterium]